MEHWEVSPRILLPTPEDEDEDGGFDGSTTSMAHSGITPPACGTSSSLRRELSSCSLVVLVLDATPKTYPSRGLAFHSLDIEGPEVLEDAGLQRHRQEIEQHSPADLRNQFLCVVAL